jgi:hypothetical protein
VTTEAEPGAEPRLPLSRERVLRAAVKVPTRAGAGLIENGETVTV